MLIEIFYRKSIFIYNFKDFNVDCTNIRPISMRYLLNYTIQLIYVSSQVETTSLYIRSYCYPTYEFNQNGNFPQLFVSEHISCFNYINLE